VVVVSAQSHGKSSILEMISGVKLPAGDGMVTKRPLVIQLRSTAGSEVITLRPREEEAESVIAHENISRAVADETLRSDKEQYDEGNPSGVVDLPMTLRVERNGLPDVTLIDLPGIKYDNAAAETRMKALIAQRIEPRSSIILVVHNAAVDADTNEGFKLARAADPSGQRTLCALTHVDIIADPHAVRNCVIKLLNERATKFFATCCPTACQHDSITWTAALQAEREFFATHPLLAPGSEAVRAKGCTSTAALGKFITQKYISAVIVAQEPLQAELFKMRADLVRELVALPERQPPLVRFTFLWQALVTDAKRWLESNSADLHPVRAAHKACERQMGILMSVPRSLVTIGEDGWVRIGTNGLADLCNIIKGVGGTMLPGFQPFPPLQASPDPSTPVATCFVPHTWRTWPPQVLADRFARAPRLKPSRLRFYRRLQEFNSLHVRKSYKDAATEILVGATASLHAVKRKAMHGVRGSFSMPLYEKALALIEREADAVTAQIIANIRRRLSDLIKARADC